MACFSGKEVTRKREFRVKPTAHSSGLPGDVDIIKGSAFLPAPAYRQEGGVSSRLARKEFGVESSKRGMRDGSLGEFGDGEGRSESLFLYRSSFVDSELHPKGGRQNEKKWIRMDGCNSRRSPIFCTRPGGHRP